MITILAASCFKDARINSLLSLCERLLLWLLVLTRAIAWTDGPCSFPVLRPHRLRNGVPVSNRYGDPRIPISRRCPPMGRSSRTRLGSLQYWMRHFQQHPNGSSSPRHSLARSHAARIAVTGDPEGRRMNAAESIQVGLL